VFADVDSPVYLQGAFDLAVAMVENQPKVEAAFRSGMGVGWGDQAPCLFCTVGRFFRPGYHNNLVASWLPALDGVAAKLERGATVADVGCGHGFSTIIMAKTFPKSTFVGYDFHPASVEQARIHAEQHGAAANTKFEVALAKDFPAKDLDLVTFFDCLHDMGDPVGAARHVRQILKPDGSWMIVEPAAGDRLEDKSQSREPNVLRGVHHDLHSNFARSAGRSGVWRSGGLRKAVIRDHGRRIQQSAQGDRYAVQHDPGGAALRLMAALEPNTSGVGAAAPVSGRGAGRRRLHGNCSNSPN
jgi:ubiquinone/menaquinone biosynthesis C-methylase UbiE